MTQKTNWEALRDKFFKECTSRYKTFSQAKHGSFYTTPEKVFEWFKKELQPVKEEDNYVAEAGKQIGWETPTGALISENDYSFLPTSQQQQCKPYFGKFPEFEKYNYVASVQCNDEAPVVTPQSSSANSIRQLIQIIKAREFLYDELEALGKIVDPGKIHEDEYNGYYYEYSDAGKCFIEWIKGIESDDHFTPMKIAEALEYIQSLLNQPNTTVTEIDKK
jgi:hypothetical protein